jgi:hypothetical protein
MNMKMVVVGERAKMNNENKYFTYKDALFATAVLCITLILQLVQFEKLEDRVKELEKKVLVNE